MRLPGSICTTQPPFVVFRHPGYTTGDAIAAIREVAAATTLPHGFDIAFEDLSYDESRRGNEALFIFIIVIIFVYLVLAAQYESFLLPMAGNTISAGRGFWIVSHAQNDGPWPTMFMRRLV